MQYVTSNTFVVKCDVVSCISSQAVLQVLHMKAARLYYQHIYCALIIQQ